MAERPPVLIKVLTATLTLLRNHLLVGNDPTIALSDAMDMLERWDHRGEDLRTTPIIEKQLTDHAKVCTHYARPNGSKPGQISACLNCGHPQSMHPEPVTNFGRNLLQSSKPGQAVTQDMTGHDAARYQWLREHPAFETEAVLASLTPGEFDALVDRRRGS
jgi:hypothetical protein